MQCMRKKTAQAFTLIETMISIAIIGLSVGGIVIGYNFACRQAEWTSYSLAAQSLAIQRLEQTRSASWDPLRYPPADDLMQTNFPVVYTNLDIPLTGTNTPYCTNTTTITLVSTNPYLKLIKVDAVWNFRWSNQRTRLFTNTVMTYRAPDQ